MKDIFRQRYEIEPQQFQLYEAYRDFLVLAPGIRFLTGDPYNEHVAVTAPRLFSEGKIVAIGSVNQEETGSNWPAVLVLSTDPSGFQNILNRINERTSFVRKAQAEPSRYPVAQILPGKVRREDIIQPILNRPNGRQLRPGMPSTEKSV